MKKQEYISPTLEIVEIDRTDVLTESFEDGGGFDIGGEGWFADGGIENGGIGW